MSPIRRAVASGHGIGKSALTAWIVLWLMSTRPDARGTVTANTYVQLETKTWAAIQKWHKLCLTAPWFVCTTNRLYHRDSKETWFCSPATCKEENSEAFAGQHAADASSFYIFDEASAVPDKIFEVAEGGLTDGHPFIFLFGNPTRSHRQVLPRVLRQRERDALGTQVDRLARLPLPNKELIAEWIETYGEDSDFVRVRVRGLPPAADELQFIDRERIKEAQEREPQSLRRRSADLRRGRQWRRRRLERRGLPPRRGCALDPADPDPRRAHARSQCAGGQAGRDPERQAARSQGRRHVHRYGIRLARSTNACARWGSTTCSK